MLPRPSRDLKWTGNEGTVASTAHLRHPGLLPAMSTTEIDENIILPTEIHSPVNFWSGLLPFPQNSPSRSEASKSSHR
jgi:hypothetical protein